MPISPLQQLAVQLGTAVIVAMTLFVFAFWLMRRKETPLLWLTATGLVLSLRNLAYLTALPVVPAGVSPEAADILIYLLLFCIAGFALSHFSLGRARLILLCAAGAAAFAITVRGAGSLAGLDSAPHVIVTLLGLVAVAALYAMPLKDRLGIDRIVLFAAFCLFALTVLHDAGAATGWWSGAGMALAPHVSLVMFAAVTIAAVRNILNALTAKEDLSQVLGMRIETTKANLIASESARRSLEVSNAITKERERMMREIHDGIGSSLVAALASAERQGRASSTAVVALKSALTDLRIAVDSLEPVEGNVTTLLANLRYRLEPEMKKANIGFAWAVEDVPELPWLDSPNALHVLRIFQEAFGNILGHANANKITVGCRQEYLDGRPGVRIEVSDDGEGFDLAIPPRGRGRKNMIERAEALGGRLGVYSSPGAGSSTVLWLPLERAQG
jgi:signal transduction histidine kinase